MLARSDFGCFGFSWNSVIRPVSSSGQDPHPARLGERARGGRRSSRRRAAGGGRRRTASSPSCRRGRRPGRGPRRPAPGRPRTCSGGRRRRCRGTTRWSCRARCTAGGCGRRRRLRSRSHGRPEPMWSDERARVVLGQHGDVVDVRVDAVREGEVDDPELAAEGDGRLGPLLREDGEARALAAGQDHRQGPLHRPSCARVGAGSWSSAAGARSLPRGDRAARRTRAASRRGAGALRRKRRGLTKLPLYIDRPVEVRAGRPPGHPDVGDHLAGRDRWPAADGRRPGRRCRRGRTRSGATRCGR